MNKADNLESYEAPELLLLGSFEDITRANVNGNNFDSNFAAHPMAQETHS